MFYFFSISLFQKLTLLTTIRIFFFEIDLVINLATWKRRIISNCYLAMFHLGRISLPPPPFSPLPENTYCGFTTFKASYSPKLNIWYDEMEERIKRTFLIAFQYFEGISPLEWPFRLIVIPSKCRMINLCV